MDHNISVYFVCQRCLQPLSLDQTFDNIGEHKKAELQLPLITSPNIELDTNETNFHQFVQAFNLSDSDNESSEFTILEDGKTFGLSNNIEVAAALFDIISRNTEINHPLCEECTDTLLEIMDQHLFMVKDDCVNYKHYFEKLNKEGDFDIQAMYRELDNLNNVEQQLVREIEILQKEEKQIYHDIEEAEKEKKQMKQEERRLWREHNQYSRKLFLLEDDYKSLEYQLNYAEARLDRLKKTNVFTTAFSMWHEGHFLKINNLRLGRLPSVPVDWSEINAAWGQTTLLLVALATRANLTFQRYRLVPYGNQSYVQVLADSKELPLHASGGFRFLLNPKFDAAMVAFLDCLQQFKEEIEKGKSGFNLPYPMEKGKITDSGSKKSYSISMQFNSEEQWTIALNLMLTNLKWVITWVVSQFCND